LSADFIVFIIFPIDVTVLIENCNHNTIAQFHNDMCDIISELSRNDLQLLIVIV